MFVSVNREALLAGLKVVAPAVASTSSALPVLSHVKIEVTDSQMILSGNRLELALQTAVEIDARIAVPEVGAVLLPHKLLVDLLNEMSDEFVVLSSELALNKVEIQSGDGHVRLEGLEADDFAITPVILTEQSTDVTVDPEWFAGMCKRLIFSAATDDTRPTLKGVMLRVVDGQLEAATTDGYRLTVWKEEVEWEDVNVIIPAKPLADVLSVMAPTQITFNCQMMRFQDDQSQATLSLIGGDYPDYDPIVAMAAEGCILRCPKGGLKQAIMLADVIARGDTRNHMVNIVHVGSEIQIGAAYSQWGENTSVCPAEIVSGQPRKFGINAKYFGDAVTHASGEDVDIILQKDIGGPIHLRAVADDRWLAVIMPINMQHI